MAYFKHLVSCVLCLILSKENSAKIYVFDVPNGDDALLSNYDDYDPINEFNYDYLDRTRIPKDYIDIPEPKIQKLNRITEEKVQNMCQRVFGSMYGQRNKHIRCMKSVNQSKQNQRSHDTRSHKLKRKFRQYSEYYPSPKLHKPFMDLTRFSQDYLDVKDLGRSEGFAGDYLDVNDFRKSWVIPDCDVQVDEFGGMTKSDPNCAPQI